ncbi:MAG TPA: copper resistance protein NlpE, partial [Lysobacter sp.]|nr:copper resistance protein NlpE [Lysobacter sp.]
MNPKFLALACIGAFALAACTQKDAAPAAPATDASAVAPADAGPAPADVVPSGQAPDSDFDQRAFAGTFTGTLPCADCPGIDVTLTLQGDGTYRISNVYQERPDSAWGIDGHWTVEADNTAIR